MKPDVFGKLQLKFSVEILMVLSVVVLMLIGSMNMYLSASGRQEVESFIKELVRNNGRFPRWQSLAAQTGIRDFFSARLNAAGEVIEVITPFAGDALGGTPQEWANAVLGLKHPRGVYLGFSYCVMAFEDDGLFVLLDRRYERERERRCVALFAVLLLAGMAVTLVAAVFLFYWGSRPVRDAFVRQRQFVADASHELKTPIAVIGANIAVLEHEIRGNKWLEYIKTENARMESLVRDMLYLAKDDAGGTEYNVLPFDLADAAARAVLPFESVAYEQGKRLEIEIPQEPVPVEGDEIKIKQVAIILTDNALKNSEKGAEIRITVGTEGSRGYVRVYNTGNGIAEADMKKIFSRFYRADSARARSTGGYGLGLAIAQAIAQGHRGEISAESEVGRYARFTLWLPVNK